MSFTSVLKMLSWEQMADLAQSGRAWPGAKAEKCGSGQRRLAVDPPIRTGEPQSASRHKNPPFLFGPAGPGKQFSVSVFMSVEAG